MNNLIRRTITGIVCIILILLSILIDQRLFALLFLLITLLGLWEFFSLVESDKIKPNKPAGLFAGAFIFISNALISLDVVSFKLLVFCFLPLFLIFLFELYRKKAKLYTNIAYNVLGIIYIAIPFSLLNYFPNTGFTEGVYNNKILMGFFFLVWTNETGAYLAGKFFGRTKLFKSVSPNKSWEGLIGGGLLSILVSWVISVYFTDISFVNWFVIALIILVFGTYGDLFESMLKRCHNVKDSGTILPGHGGVLDRFDGVLVAAPFVFAYLLLIS